MNYQDFLKTKAVAHKSLGIDIAPDTINPMLFNFQRDLTQWALRKGRAGIFAECGLGKSPMQLEFARLTGEKSLIIAPLSVAQQTVDEGVKFDVPVHYCRTQSEATHKINITNYEMFQHGLEYQRQVRIRNKAERRKRLENDARGFVRGADYD